MSKFICYVLVLSWALAAVFLGTAGAVGGRASYPRTNRGFKNAQLSTARGFGKRGEAVPALPPSPLDGIFSDARSSYPVGWLVEEMQNNPEVARLVVERFVDENGDGELTPDELFRRVYF